MRDLTVYCQLANRIDGRPRDVENGNTEANLYVHAMSLMVTEEEANVACMCSQELETAEQIAEREGVDVEEIRDLLYAAARGGVLLWTQHDGVDLFKLHGWYPGIGETAPLVKGEHEAEIAEIFQKMSELVNGPDERAALPFGRGPMRVIPIGKTIKANQKIAKYEDIKTYLDQSDIYSFADCACRKMERTKGNPCEHPVENMCIQIGDMADYYIRTGRGVAATREEVEEKIRFAARNGMVQHYFNNEGENVTSMICNCCGCSCMGMKTENWFRTPNYDKSNFVAQVNPENCVACGACSEICQMNAIRLGTTFCSIEEQTPVTTRTPDEFRWTMDDLNPEWNKKVMVNDHGTSPCKTRCPAHISIQGYIRKAAEGKYDEALKVIKRENPFPAVCGRVCPHSCENECARANVDEAMAIDDIKKFIADKELESEHRYIPEVYEHYEEKVAVIGAGPAGMTAAYYLAAEGYPVTVFDRNPAPGGMLRYGIPSFRLEKDVIDAEIDVLHELGVEFKCGVNVGEDVTLQQLREEGYKAFYIAVGAQKGTMLRIDGIDLAGVVSGVDFLRSVALGELTEQKGKTVVIGGGNVAIDVARTAVRLGAASTNLFCLESKAEMPALEEEQNEASAEGVVLNNGWGPKRILGENGKVTGVEFMRCVSVFDENGKFAPKYDENDIVVVECENVLLSVGQTMDWGKLLDGSQMQLSARKTLSVKEVSYQTEEADVFAGGDAVSGPKFAIDAIAMGKSGAVSIHRYLRGRSLTMRREREYKPFNTEAADFSGFDKMPRQRPLAVDHKKAAGTMADLRGNFTEEQLQKEAKRCLGCGVAVVDPYMCVGCGLCANKCEFDALHLVKVDNPVASAATPMDYMTDVYTYMMSREAKLAAKEAEAQK